jgi:ABC-2 type transport system ATP-binding protein
MTTTNHLEELVRGRQVRRPAAARPGTGAMIAAIALENLTKTYADNTEAVRGVSLSVEAGAAYGLLGPNGAGKSTTLGMLGTLVRPTSGVARVGGFDVATEPHRVRRAMGFAMQQAGLDELATPLELLVLQGRLQGVGKAEAMRRAGLLLSLIELEQIAHKRLSTLSGGMLRRVDLASALVHLPAIVLLDEPTEGLDPRSRAAIWETLEGLRAELGITLVITTHYMEEADRLCERIGIIDQGLLIAEGTAAALKASVGSQALVIEFSPDASSGAVAAVRDQLAEEHDVHDVLGVDRTLSVLVEDAAAMAPHLLRRAESVGITPRSLAITEPTLEDVYLRYTGRAFESTAETNGDEWRRAA